MQIKTNDFKAAEFTGKISEPSKADRLKESLKKMFIFWGLSIASVFIPVLHFFLVPLFLLMGIGFFFFQMKQTHVMENLKFNCPSCGQENKIIKMYFKDSHRFRCQSCSTQIILS